MTRDEAVTRYQELPVPDTTMEPWRFTDLAGFDPDAFGHAVVPGTKAGPEETMLDIAVAGWRASAKPGSRSRRHPRA